MAEEVKIPPFGESITTANVSRWHKSDGDAVKKGDVLVTLETDKVSQELEADYNGILKILVAEDQEVEVGALIAEIDTTAGGAAGEAPAQPSASETDDAKSSPTVGEVHEIKIPSFGDSINTASLAAWEVQSGSTVTKGQTLITLESDKVSQELTADYSGTIEILVEEGEEVGIGTTIARLTEGEGSAAPTPPSPPQKSTPAPASSTPVPAKAQTALATAAAEASRLKPNLTTATSTPAPADSSSVAPVSDGRSTRKKMSMLRRKIAQHLVNAQQTAAILSTFNEVDMTAIMKLRKEVQEEFVAKHGVKLGFMSLFTKAVVSALKENPGIRSFIEGNEIVENDFYDIGVAVGTEKGLVVPVIRDCDEKSFAEIEQAIGQAAAKAKDGTMQIEDLQGGVFTISNGGVYGSLLSTPILNPPQSGILGMHTIQQRPVAVNGQVEIRPMMYLALSYDHRIVDGKEAVTFLIHIKESLENPARLLLEC